MDLTHSRLETENQSLFGWVHSGEALGENKSLFGWFHSGEALGENQSLFGSLYSEEALGDATYISDSGFSVALYGGALDQTTELLQDLPPSIDPLHISPINAVPQEYHRSQPCMAPALDDFNFDSFPWDDPILGSNVEVAADLSIAPSDLYSGSIGYHLDDTPCEQIRKDRSWPMAAGQGASTGMLVGVKQMEKGLSVRSRSSSIGFDEVSKYFSMPIMEAARAMKVGLTVLKKKCRELGISRWPHRKMKSLNSLIRNVQELGKGIATEDSIRREVETLEDHKRLMEKMPEMQLSERTKRLRQACFKANFKKRRAVQYSPGLNTQTIRFPAFSCSPLSSS